MEIMLNASTYPSNYYVCSLKKVDQKIRLNLSIVTADIFHLWLWFTDRFYEQVLFNKSNQFVLCF